MVRQVLVRLEKEVALHVELLAERGEPPDGIVGAVLALGSIFDRETQSITEDSICIYTARSIACSG